MSSPTSPSGPLGLTSRALEVSSQTLLSTLITRTSPTTAAGVSPRATLLVNLENLQGGISNRASLYDAEAMQILTSRPTHHASPSNTGAPSSPRSRSSPLGTARSSPSATSPFTHLATTAAPPSPTVYTGSSSSSSSPRTARTLQLGGSAAAAAAAAASAAAAAAAADPFLGDPILKQPSEALPALEATASVALLPASPASPAGRGGGSRAQLQATVAAMEAELGALKLQLAAAASAE